jgi:hypothetical protein
MTSSGIKPATLQSVAYSLSQLRYRVLQRILEVNINVIVKREVPTAVTGNVTVFSNVTQFTYLAGVYRCVSESTATA